MVLIEEVRPDDPRALSLITELDRLQSALYPAESNHLDSTVELSLAHVHFLGAMSDGAMLGCGAVKLMVDASDGITYGEIKRMFVAPRARGKGIAKGLMTVLEERAITNGATLMRLETGIYQPEAIGLYESLDFRRRGPFGTYGPDPVSVFMEKPLPARAAHGVNQPADRP